MTNDFDTPVWADHHRDLSNAIRDALSAVAAGLKRLHDMQWAAPWQHETGRVMRCMTSHRQP